MLKIFAIVSLLFFITPQEGMAESKEILNLEIKDTIHKFKLKARGAEEFLKKTNGYLVIPNFFKAGFIVGGGYGEGGLIIDGNITDYYSAISASFGFQAGAQKKSIIIAFLTKEALDSFRRRDKWKVGVDGSIAFVNWGRNIDLSTVDFKKSIIAFAFNNQGLMLSLSLDGTVFTKIYK